MSILLNPNPNFPITFSPKIETLVCTYEWSQQVFVSTVDSRTIIAKAEPGTCAVDVTIGSTLGTACSHTTFEIRGETLREKLTINLLLVVALAIILAYKRRSSRYPVAEARPESGVQPPNCRLRLLEAHCLSER